MLSGYQMGQKISVLRHESHKGSCKTHTIIIDRFYYDGMAKCIGLFIVDIQNI